MVWHASGLRCCVGSLSSFVWVHAALLQCQSRHKNCQAYPQSAKLQSSLDCSLLLSPGVLAAHFGLLLRGEGPAEAERGRLDSIWQALDVVCDGRCEEADKLVEQELIGSCHERELFAQVQLGGPLDSPLSDALRLERILLDRLQRTNRR